MPIDNELYMKLSGVRPKEAGGQELILYEILAAIPEGSKVFLPFYSNGLLAKYLVAHNYKVITDETKNTYDLLEYPQGCVVYFGTPTIVDNTNLFPDFESWNKSKEREVVRRITEKAIIAEATKIICGLGSGDISVEERMRDIGGGSLITYKKFNTFEDWVIERRLVA